MRSVAATVCTLFLVSMIGLLPTATLAVDWDETTNGDLSNTGQTPTVFSLTPGANRLIATTGAGDDVDYLTFTLDDGMELSSLTLTSYSGTDRIAFIGLMNGTEFTEPKANPNVANLIGWAHFGPGRQNVGNDLLPGIGTGAGAQGFTPPLPAGSYSVWLQQQGGSVTYQLDWLVASNPIATPGDFDGDGLLTAADIDALSADMRAGTNSPQFDVNGDGAVDSADHLRWVTELKRTYIGDANLDAEFNSTDFVFVFTAGQYEDAVSGNSTWATGDWNGDADFSSADFVAAFTEGGYEQGPRAAVSAVPEPVGCVLIPIGVALLAGFRRRRKP